MRRTVERAAGVERAGRVVSRRRIGPVMGAMIGAAGVLWSAGIAPGGAACEAARGGQPLAPNAGRPAMPAEARAVLERALAAYKTLPGYSDVLVMDFHLDVKNDAGDPVTVPNMPTREIMKVWYAAPDRFRMEYEDLEVICDGTTVWGVNKNEGWYTEERAYQTATVLEMSPYKQYTTRHLPLTTVLRRPQTAGEFLRRIEVTGVSTVTLDGRELSEISGFQLLGGSRTPIRFYFSRETGLLERMTMDLTESYRKQIDKAYARAAEAPASVRARYPKTADSAGWVNVVTELQVGEPPAELFVFTPDASYTKRAHPNAAATPPPAEKKAEKPPPMDGAEPRYQDEEPGPEPKGGGGEPR